MKELAIVKYIKENGLAKALTNFKLKSNICENKILLKYDMLESPMHFEEVRECRGLILERDTWKVMNCGFYKFFNAQEVHAAKIDWDTARIYEKVDGSNICLYFDWYKAKWVVSTTGSPEADGTVNNIDGTTFAELFWNTILVQSRMFNKHQSDLNFLKKGTTYIFELCTPFNIVVKPHTTSSLTLLGVRNLETLEEGGYDELIELSKILDIPLVKSFDIKNTNVDLLVKTFVDIRDPFFEGYVVCDANFNRIKIKTPTYISLHHLKSKSSPYEIMQVIKTNEIDEFLAYVPERTLEILNLKDKYNTLIEKISGVWNELKIYLPKDDSLEGKKDYAMKVFELSNKNGVGDFTGLFFSLKDKKIDSIKEFMINYDNKLLYKKIS